MEVVSINIMRGICFATTTTKLKLIIASELALLATNGSPRTMKVRDLFFCRKFYLIQNSE